MRVSSLIWRTIVTVRCFFYGLLLPLSFAPFHLPGFAIISLALFYYELNKPQKDARLRNLFWHGMAYGLGFFGVGASWVYVSIHVYGHFNIIIAGLITLLFIVYLSLFPALMAVTYAYLRIRPYSFVSLVAFPALWTLSELLRSTVFTGFPWLLVEFGQFDSPIQSLLPIIGVYGVTFITALAATLLSLCLKESQIKRIPSLGGLLFLILSPGLISLNDDNSNQTKPIQVGIIQANLSMRDKWDEQLFWHILDDYQKQIHTLLGTELIVLPESAIPVSASYISDILRQISQEAKKAGSSILLGIPKPTEFDESNYYNALMALGHGEGTYLKQHLVPFGEYIPKPFQHINRMLKLPELNLHSGAKNQPLITVQNKPIATLICYELAYGNLLRQQLPAAELIVSISDDGWFGHSLAMAQHQQIAQVRSLQTARYQLMANNDGLSSIIDASGHLVDFLPPFSAGLLRGTVIPMTQLTPWVVWGDAPILFGVGLIALICLTLRLRCRIAKNEPLAV